MPNKLIGMSIVLSLIFLLASCGQYGSLYLPEKGKPKHPVKFKAL